MAAVLHLRTAHLARVVVLKRQDSGETKARHYVAYGLKVGQKSILGGFGQSVIGPKRANRVVPQAVPHPYMMHMLGWGQWVRQGSMRGDARVSGEYATKGLVGERISRTILPPIRGSPSLEVACARARPYTHRCDTGKTRSLHPAVQPQHAHA